MQTNFMKGKQMAHGTDHKGWESPPENSQKSKKIKHEESQPKIQSAEELPQLDTECTTSTGLNSRLSPLFCSLVSYPQGSISHWLSLLDVPDSQLPANVKTKSLSFWTFTVVSGDPYPIKTYFTVHSPNTKTGHKFWAAK